MSRLTIEIGDTVSFLPHKNYNTCQGVCIDIHARYGTYRISWDACNTSWCSFNDLTLIKKGKKEMKEFTKSDLIKLAQSNTVFVKQGNGNMKVVLGDNLCGDKSRWSRIVEFKADLTNEKLKELDIISVYKASEGSSLTSYLAGHFLTLIWERTEQTEAQKEIEVLQDKMEKAKEAVAEVQEQITKLQSTL
jgi:hypothetical protein